MEIVANSVSQAVNEGFQWLAVAGREDVSRNGRVIVAPEPVLTRYLQPTHRVLFSPLRDANPYFHLMESLWMLAGRNDIAFPAYFNSRFKLYSDDGYTQPGAYGWRWRCYFGYDQLNLVAQELSRRPDSRRAVLAMWDGGCGADHPQVGEDGGTTGDFIRLQHGTNDAPCNTHAYFDIVYNKLNLTVCCRSNDMYWGGYGANAVHMSVLQEYMASWLNVGVGEYRQFSNNFHVYPEILPGEGLAPRRLHLLACDADITDEYKRGTRTFPLVNTNVATWDADLAVFFASRDGNPVMPRFKDVFFSSVVWPMWRSWRARKDKTGTGLEDARLIAAPDWRRACVDWIVRREAKKEKQNG